MSKQGTSLGVGVAGALVLAAVLIDGLVILPRYEAGRGDHGEAVAVWLLVNLAPAAVAILLARAAGRSWRGTLAWAFAAIAATGCGIVVALLLYIGTGLD